MNLRKLIVFFKNISPVIFISAILMFLFLLIFNNSLENYTSFEMIFIGGHLSGEPLNSYETLAYIGYIDALKWLYNYSKEFNWLYFLHLSILYVAFVMMYYSIVSLWNKNKNIWITILIGLLIFIPYGINILNINITRESILLAASGMMFLVGVKDIKKRYVLISFVLVLLAFFARAETSFLTVFLTLILSFPILKKKKYGMRKYLVFVPNVLLAVIFLGSVMTYRLSSSQYYLSTDVEQYVISDSQFDIVQEYESVEDSMFFYALQIYFINDTSVFNEERIESFFEKRFSGTETNFFNNIKANSAYALGQLSFVIDKNYIFYLYLIVVLATLSYVKNIYYLLSHIVFWLYLFCIAYVVKMEVYVFSPFLIIAIYFSLIYVGVMKGKWLNKAKLYLAVIIYFIVLLFVIKDYLVQKNNYNEFSDISKNYLTELSEVGKAKVVVIDVISNQMLIKRPSDIKYFKKQSEFYFFDMGQLALIKQYELYHNKICNCNSLDVKQVIDFFLTNNEEVIFVSNLKRMTFIKNYLKIMHKINVDFSELIGNYEVEKLDEGNLNYFKINLIKD